MFQLLLFPPKSAITKIHIFVLSCFRFFSKKMPPDAPVLNDNPFVKRRKRKDLPPLERQFAIEQSLRNLQHGEDGKGEIDGELILLPGFNQKLARKLDVIEKRSGRCGNERETSVPCLLCRQSAHFIVQYCSRIKSLFILDFGMPSSSANLCSRITHLYLKRISDAHDRHLELSSPKTRSSTHDFRGCVSSCSHILRFYISVSRDSFLDTFNH
jgi:hypothetical protein